MILKDESEADGHFAFPSMIDIFVVTCYNLQKQEGKGRES